MHGFIFLLRGCEKVRRPNFDFFIDFHLGIAPKRNKSQLWLLGVFCKNFTKPITAKVVAVWRKQSSLLV